MTKKELLKLPQCMECKKRDKEKFYVKWSNGKHTCLECTSLAYHLVNADKLVKQAK